jgi:hypothetical protein
MVTLFLVLSLVGAYQETAAEQGERRINEFLSDLRTAIERQQARIQSCEP